MAFDFLPDEAPPPPKPNTEEAAGGQFSVGNNVFYDNYKHHLDAHSLFSLPPKGKEFNLPFNFEQTKDYYFSERTVKGNVEDGWYGPGTELEKLKQGYTSFQDPELLNKAIGQIDNEIPQDMFSAIEKPKMKINDKFGMFSFDLASMAMTYAFDYYNLKGEKVDSSFVEKRGSKFIYIPENEEVKQFIRRREDGTPVVVSSVRNSLIDFEKTSKQDRSVEIMVFNSFAVGEGARSVVYNSMAAISVAKNLILKGFRVKITSVLVVFHADEKKRYFHFVPAKRFNQPLDMNAAAYICGDPRFFRYQGFKMIISGYDQDKVRIPGGLGRIESNAKSLSLIIEKEYVENSSLKQADTRLYFGGSRSLEGAKQETQIAIDILNDKYAEKP